MTFPGHRGVHKPDGSTPDAWAQIVCGHCGAKVSAAIIGAFSVSKGPDARKVRWLLCPNCSLGSVLNNDELSPGAPFGPELEGLPPDVVGAYSEARRCMEVHAFTAAELLCRKILMHVAVDKGATEGDTFAAYLSFLETHGFITPPMKPWVSLIREHGNAATHQLAVPDERRAQSTVMFTAELLRLVYEMEHLAGQFTRPGP